MSFKDGNQRKRPPPINVPTLPGSRSATNPNHTQRNYSSSDEQQHRRQQQQYDVKSASATIQQSSWSNGSSPLKSPREQNASSDSALRSQKNKSDKIFSDPVPKSGVSSHRSDYDSTGKRHFTTTRYSDLSNRSATVMSDQPEVRNEKTGRAKIEARNEQKWFKMAGQLPPTPSTGAINEDSVHIRTEDLRAQCQTVNKERNSDRDELAKSPKKTLFGNLRNAFNRTPNNAPPPMPPKAAQVFGTAPRAPHEIEMRPIIPPESIVTPVKLARSDTSKSLPDKIGDSHKYARHYGRSLSRRSRHAQKSPSKGDTGERPPLPQADVSSQSVCPPTPPAKDTPRKMKPTVMPSSPLRRTRPSEHLHQAYGATLDHSVKLRTPEFALSSSPFDVVTPKKCETSLTKYHAHGHEEHAKVIEDEPVQWPCLEANGWSGQKDGNHPISPVTRNRGPTNLLHARGSNEINYPNHDGYHWRSPPLESKINFDNAVVSLTEGEPGSQNAHVDPLLSPIPSETELHLLPEGSNQGSIQMIYQGDANDIDPASSTANLINSANKDTLLSAGSNDTAMMTRTEQEQHTSEDHSYTPQGKGPSNYFPLEKSSSRLTDMLSGVSPCKKPLQGNFLPNCPSAVPSPLHNAGALFSQPPSNRPAPVPFRQLWQPRTPNTVEEHFYMTNEHLDVVGKTTWDLLEAFKQHQSTTLNSRQDKLLASVEKGFEGVKSQIVSLNEKANYTSEKQDKILATLDKLFAYITQDVSSALAAQEKKAVEMETHVTELRKTVQMLQQWLEQKFTDMKSGLLAPNLSATNVPLSMHRSQPGVGGFYDNSGEYGQENQAPMPHGHDNRSTAPMHDSHHDQRVGHGNGYGQQWGARHGYPGRFGKEDRSPYSGSSPYHFGGQYGNGYMGGYSNYGFSPDVSEQHGSYNQGPTK